MKRIAVGIIIVISIIFGVLYFGMISMEIEDKYGDLQELYYDAEDGDLIIIDNNQAGFIKRYDRDVFVENGENLKHVLYFWDKKIEVYKVKTAETYFDIGYNEALKIKNKPDSELIYKNF